MESSAHLSDIKLPKYTANDLNEVVSSVIPVLQKETKVLDLFAPMIVVGSLQGSLFNLYQILSRFGLPPTRSYIFLGNIVGDGQFSIETIAFLYALKTVYPRNIYILRGLNEIRSYARRRSFFRDAEKIDSTHDLFNRFIESFSYLPLAATLFNSVFCCSGGLTSGLKYISEINNISGTKELAVFCKAEPSNTTASFRKDKMTYFYGHTHFERFMASNSITLMITGNVMTHDGCKYSFGNRLISLFSASGLNGSGNNSSVLAIFAARDYKTIKMPKIQRYTRESVSFVSFSELESKHPNQQMKILALPKIAPGATTSRKTAMRILETSKNSIPSGHPILTLFNGVDKLSKISRIRTFGTSRTPAVVDTFY
jgi:uncharacterized protein YejL (UPF0352 family)